MTPSTPRHRGHIRSMSMTARRRVTRRPADDDGSVTFADLGLTDDEGRTLVAALARERARDAARERARTLAATITRVVAERDKARRAEAERRAQADRIRARTRRWRASKAAMAAEAERERLREHQRSLDRGVALLDSLRRR